MLLKRNCIDVPATEWSHSSNIRFSCTCTVDIKTIDSCCFFRLTWSKFGNRTADTGVTESGCGKMF